MKSIRQKIKKISKPLNNNSRLSLLSEKLHIQAHLALTEFRLRFFSGKENRQHKKRQQALDVLREYWQKGIFPENTYKAGLRTPVFIDKKGTYCAVGYLMHKTGNTALAKRIDQENKFVLVDDLNDEEVKVWLHEYGFSQEEAALVQPGYEFREAAKKSLELVPYTWVDKILDALLIVGCLIVVAGFITATQITYMKGLNKTSKSAAKKKLKFLSVSVVAVIILLFVANEAFLAEKDKKETCGYGGLVPTTLPFRDDNVCDSYEKYGKASGWQKQGSKTLYNMF